MDLHLLHISSSLGREGSAVNPREVEDGLVVVCITFELSMQDNPALFPITDQLKYLVPAGSKTKPEFDFNNFKLSNILAPILQSSYFSYKGSLTTPSCNEVVRWLVIEDTIVVSRHQLKLFRALWDESGNNLVNNFRPIQPLNGRTIYYSDNSWVWDW